MVFIFYFMPVLKNFFKPINRNMLILSFNIKYIVILPKSFCFFIKNAYERHCFFAVIILFTKAFIQVRQIFSNHFLFKIIQLRFTAFNIPVVSKCFVSAMVRNPIKYISALPNVADILTIKKKINADYLLHLYHYNIFFHDIKVKIFL